MPIPLGGYPLKESIIMEERLYFDSITNRQRLAAQFMQMMMEVDANKSDHNPNSSEGFISFFDTLGDDVIESYAEKAVKMAQTLCKVDYQLNNETA
jgi:uncharacterized OsmC-like protein